MPHRKLNRIIALCVFVVALAVYALTMAPTVVFWDVGEFIAAADMLQVPHPPGAPLFLLVTRVAMMIPIRRRRRRSRPLADGALQCALGDVPLSGHRSCDPLLPGEG